MADSGNTNPRGFSSSIAELPPLYKRINWTALLVPPAGIILLLLLAIYVYPYLMKKTRSNQLSKRYKDDDDGYAKCEENNEDNCVEINKLRSDDGEDIVTAASDDVVWIHEKLESTPNHKQVERTTPSPSPKLGRLSLSQGPPLVSEENFQF